MDRQTIYLSFWDIEMSNLPVGTFRRRALSPAEARNMANSARASGTLVCVAKDDLGAPYCEREREKHGELCAALRDHADIEIHLKDFFGGDCANPLCFAEVGPRRSLLVVDCHYSFADDDRPGIRATNIPDLDETSKAQATRLLKGAMRMCIVPDPIQFYVFEQIEP
jgi:hypothetical protein